MLQNSIANDGYIDQTEDMMLQNQMANIQALINQMKTPTQQAQLAQQPQQQVLDPKAMGLDRHRVMGVPVGPSLVPNFNLSPVASAPVIPQESMSSVPSVQPSLVPQGAEDILHSGVRCEGITTKGARCLRKVQGNTLCWQHRG